MKKRFLLLLSMLVMLCSTIFAAKYDFHVGGVYFRILLNNQLEPTTNLEVVSGDEKYTGDIIIPSGIKVGETEYTVTQIGQDAFYDCKDVTSVSLPNDVTSKLEVIEARAFGNCEGLTSIRIPDTVKEIGQFAFHQCKNLKSVYMGRGLQIVRYNAFGYCEALERVEISDLAAWCGIAFYYYGTSSGWFGPYANPLSYAGHLYLNGKEVVDLVIPEEVTSIHGDLNFYGCVGLKSVTFPDNANVEYIGAWTFAGCENITTLKLNKHLKRIYECAFSGCKLIESLVIPDEVTLIEAAAFSGCTNLKDLKLGKAIEEIKTASLGPAFSGTAIKEITVPEKLQYLSGFWNSELSTVNIGKTSLLEIANGGSYYPLPISRINITNLSSFMNIPKNLGVYDLYLNGNLVENLTVPSAVEDVIDNAMTGCKSLKSVTIPSHVKSIGNDAFRYCTSIEKVTFEGGSPTIGQGVFNIYNNAYFVTRMQTPSESPYALVNDCYRTHILCVPAGCKEKYEAANGWKEFRYIVEAEPEDVFLEKGNLYRIYGDELSFLKGGYSGIWGYYMPETVTYQEKTYPVTTIDGVVYEGYSPDIVVYGKVKSIAEGAFASCTGVHSVTSYIKEPYAISSNVFSDEVKQTITLRVPYGTKAKYQSTDGWKDFVNIEEMEDENPPVDVESYAVYKDEVLTFYYDNQKEKREGIKYGTENENNYPGWYPIYYISHIYKVVFSPSFSSARPTSTYGWFASFTDLIEIEGIENLNTTEVVNMDYMFANCNKLETVDLSHFDTGNVTSMQLMFDQCKNLKALDLSGFDTHSLKYTYRMFGYSGITQLDLSSWETSNLVDVYSMFAGCEDLVYLNLSSFNTSHVTNMNNFCVGCKSLTTLVLGNKFVSDENVPVQNAFSICEKLKTVTFTGDIPVSINSKFFEGVGTLSAPATLAVTDQYKANYQAKFDGNMFYGGYFTLFGDGTGEMNDGDTFIHKTCEGKDMKFKVISASAKTVQVGTGEENASAIDKDYEGTVTIPGEINGFTVEEIGYNAFVDCKFSDIVFPSTLTTINGEAFLRCMSLKSIFIPRSVKYIAPAAFASCTAVESIVVEEGNEAYDSREGCNAIIISLDNVLHRGCKTTVIPSGIERINFAAFQWTPFEGGLTIPEGVTYIGQAAFYFTTMTSVSLPSTLTYIGGWSFQDCDGLESIGIPNGVTYIGDYAFSFCDNLSRVTIPASVTEIGEKAFNGNEKLNVVVSYITKPKAISDDVFMNKSDFTNAKLYVPFGTKAIYEDTDGWKNFKNIVELNAIEGDVTGDGNVSKEDIKEVESVILEPSEDYNPNMDVNHDGVVNVVDIVITNNIINNQ